MNLNPFGYLIDLRSQLVGIPRSQAVIEFDTTGTVRWANQLFLDALGYRLDEIQGKHHRGPRRSRRARLPALLARSGGRPLPARPIPARGERRRRLDPGHLYAHPRPLRPPL